MGVFFHHGFEEIFKQKVIKLHNTSMQHCFYDAVVILTDTGEWRKSLRQKVSAIFFWEQAPTFKTSIRY